MGRRDAIQKWNGLISMAREEGRTCAREFPGIAPNTAFFKECNHPLLVAEFLTEWEKSKEHCNEC